MIKSSQASRFSRLLLMAALLIFMAACSSGDEPDKIDDDPSGEILTQEALDLAHATFDEALSHIKESPSNRNPEELTAYLRALPDVEKVDNENGFINVTTKGGAGFFIDLNVRDFPNPDDISVDAIAKEINDALDSQDYPSITSAMSTATEMKDYLSDKKISSTRAADTNARVLNRKKILFYCPWPEFRGYGSKIEELAKKTGSECYIEEVNFSAESFPEWSNYDLVYVFTHGLPGGRLTVPMEILDTQYAKAAGEGLAKIGSVTIRVKNEERDLACGSLHPSLVRKSLKDLSNTIVWLYACHCGEENSAIRKDLLDKNAADFIGIKGLASTNHALTMFVDFYSQLMRGVSSRKAFNNGVNEKKLTYKFQNKDCTFTLGRYGTNNVGYDRALITGTKNNRTSLPTRAEDTGNTMSLGLQIRINSDSESSLREYGVVVKNTETGKYVKIPADSKLAQKKRYDGVTVINAVADASDALDKDGKYIYAAYFTIGDETYLSAECAEVNASILRMIFKGTGIFKDDMYFYDTTSGYSDHYYSEETMEDAQIDLFLYPDGKKAKLTTFGMPMNGDYYYIDFENQTVDFGYKDVSNKYNITYKFLEEGKIIEINALTEWQEKDSDILHDYAQCLKLIIDLTKEMITADSKYESRSNYNGSDWNHTFTFSSTLTLSEKIEIK